MKNIIILLFALVLFSHYSFSQDCNSLPADQADFCWVKIFLAESPLHDSFKQEYLKYNVGVDDYYPKGEHVPWAGNYMPLYKGGIATRWQSMPSTYPLSSEFPAWDRIKAMSIDEIAMLSPSEKMDIYLGKRDFPITKNELTRRGPARGNVQTWEGFCNGIRLAGAIFPEPAHDIVVKSKSDEIFVKFYPGDLKALGGAVYYYTECYASLGENNKRKPDAGYFDILLRYVLGKQNRSFFLDIKPGEQKWNETVVGYNRQLLPSRLVNISDQAPEGALKVIPMRVTLFLLGEVYYDQANTLTKPLIENRQLVSPWITNYELFVNVNNEILGGKFVKSVDLINEYRNLEYPDYVWLGGGKGTDEVVIGSRNDNNVLLPFFEVQNLFFISIK